MTSLSFKTAKQPATGSLGVVASNHSLGSAAGLEMLAMGGNAIDAAIGTLFALNVVEPMMVGILGAGWMNIRLASGESIIVDNYATAPQTATSDLFTPISDSWPDYMETVGDASKVGYLATGTPGTLKAWVEAVQSWGRLDLATVMAPAIRYAEQGFVVGGYLHELIMSTHSDLARFPASADLFLPNGKPLDSGERLIQPELGKTFRAIAQHGADVLYDGAVGQVIVDDIAQNGGILSMDDLRQYGTIRREALSLSYRGYEVIVPSPPCAGGLHLLQILALLEGFDVASLGFGTSDGIHLLTECFKIAFADRAAHVGDPANGHVPVEWLLSESYASERQVTIRMDKASPQNAGVLPSSDSNDTTHVTAADQEGNIASFTQTINQAFGSKVIVPGTGLLLNNCMALFDPHPGHPNSVGPGKRTVSSTSPVIVLKGGEPLMALGTPGGVRIFPSIAQAIVNVIDHGMTLQEAVEAPRVWTQGQWLEVEQEIPDSVRHELAQRGHQVQEVSVVAGGMNGIMFDQATGQMHGAACWRADGSPAALSGGPARSGIRFQSTASRR
ncbi:MAG: gamma-glutamyltransferase [Chloroflexota bacterium]